MLFIIGLLVVALPVIFRNRIKKAIYIGIAVCSVAFFARYFNLLRPEDSVREFLLAIVLAAFVSFLYSNHYFLFRKEKR